MAAGGGKERNAGAACRFVGTIFADAANAEDRKVSDLSARMQA
jgi:hypothetical protein